MLTGFLAFLQAVPAIFGGVNNFVNKYYDSKTQITVARIGGDVNVAKAIVSGVVVEGQTKVEFLRTVASNKFLLALMGGFALPIMIFMAKVILWDTMLGWGSTPAIKGEVAIWVNIIVTGIFGSGTVMGAAAMYFNRRQ